MAAQFRERLGAELADFESQVIPYISFSIIDVNIDLSVWLAIKRCIDYT